MTVVALLVGIAAGLGAGVYARGKSDLTQVLSSAIVPIALILAGAGLIALLAWYGGKHGSPLLWGQVIAFVAIVLVVLLIYATGKPHYTVVRAFTATPSTPAGATPVTYAVDTPVPAEVYATLGADQANVKLQRGLYFRLLYTGADGRWSTSKTQALLWTFAILWALLAIFIAFQMSDRFVLHLGKGSDDGTSFADLPFDDSYLILLGGYFAAAVLAKGITSAKVQGGDAKTPADESRSPVQGIKDLVSNDGGQADLGDTQFFFFNLLALTVFFAGIVPHLDQGLPNLPDFLVGLTSVSAAAYVSKKAVESSSPTIAGVIPSVARVGDVLKIQGSYLASSDKYKPTVSIAGAEVEEVGVSSASGSLAGQVVITAKVPEGAAVGEGKTVAVQPAGATSPATATITIVAATVTAVTPDPVPWRTAVQIEVTGSGFGPDPGDGRRNVKLGNEPLAVSSWTDARIVAKLGSVTGAPPAPTLELIVAAGETLRYSRPTAVEQTQMALTQVDPTPLTLLGATPVKLTGTNFGPAPGGTVELNQRELRCQTWSDTLIVAMLVDGLAPEADSPGEMTMKVERDGYAPASLPVQVALPAISVVDVDPLAVPAKSGTIITIHGTGFGLAGALTVTLDKLPLTVVTRFDTLLQATLGPEADALPEGSNPAQVVVSRPGWTAGNKAVTVTKPAA